MGDAIKIVYDPLVVTEDLPGLDKKTLLDIKRVIEHKMTTQPDVYGKPLRGPLRGYWSLRAGDYRVAYHIQGRVVHVDVIEHRSSAYETQLNRVP